MAASLKVSLAYMSVIKCLIFVHSPRHTNSPSAIRWLCSSGAALVTTTPITVALALDRLHCKRILHVLCCVGSNAADLGVTLCACGLQDTDSIVNTLVSQCDRTLLR
jgi:hypothetical protein